MGCHLQTLNSKNLLADVTLVDRFAGGWHPQPLGILNAWAYLLSLRSYEGATRLERNLLPLMPSRASPSPSRASDNIRAMHTDTIRKLAKDTVANSQVDDKGNDKDLIFLKYNFTSTSSHPCM